MRDNIFLTSIAILLALVSFLAWKSVVDAVVDPDASNWVMPIIWFSFIAVFLGIISVVFSNGRILFGLFFVSLAGSLFFGFSLLHSILFLISSLFIWFAIWSVRSEFSDRVRLRIVPPLRVGFPKIVLAFSLLISSVYYQQISQLSWEDWFGEFLVTREETTKLTSYIARFNPAFRSLEEDDLTVDEFLSEFHKDRDPIYEESQNTTSIFAEHFSSVQDDFVLTQSRLYLSGFVGRIISGDELASDVLAESINSRFLNMLPDIQESRFGQLFPFFLSSILFFTVFSLGSILMYVWICVATGILWLMIRFGLIGVKKEKIEVERIRWQRL